MIALISMLMFGVLGFLLGAGSVVLTTRFTDRRACALLIESTKERVDTMYAKAIEEIAAQELAASNRLKSLHALLQGKQASVPVVTTAVVVAPQSKDVN